MEEQLEELRRELYQSEQDWIPKRNRLRVLCEPMEVENAQHLDKLPREVWEKILDHLEEDDLFPLALSCRYFRQKQQELVARPRQSGKPRRALKTHLEQKLRNRQPASVEYLRFCCKEKGCFGFGIDPESYVQDRNILCLAAYHGHLPLLQELLLGLDERYRRSVFPSRFPSRFFSRGSKDLQEIADSAGESPSSIITFFVFSSLFYLLTSLFLFFTASAGHLETLRWLNSKGWLNLDLAILSTACMIGHLEMVQWLRSEGCPFEEKMWAPGEPCSSAAYGGHLEVLRWLRSEGCDWSVSTCSNAARNGHLEVLKWLRSEGCPWSEETSWKAAKGGHLEVLKWLRSEGCPWDTRAYSGAAKGGHLEVLKWLRSEGCPWDAKACEYAAEGGQLDVLKYLNEIGCPWDERTCEGAIRGDHLDVLKYAHEHGCPWDDTTCFEAATGGHLDVLKYARENGCPLGASCWYWAKKSVREWLKANGCPRDDDEDSDSDQNNDDYGDDYSDDDDE